MTFSIVCLSSENWDSPLPTNRQQIMRRAAARGHEVLFVETNGWLGKHVKQALSQPAVRRRLVGGERVDARVTRRKALNVLPWGQRFRLSHAVNARCTTWLVRRAARRLPAPYVVWVYDPLAAPPRAGRDLVVYDCVDDYAEQVGRDPRRRALVAEADERVARAAGLVFTTARPLFARQRERNPQTHLVPNVADYDHFAVAADARIAPAELAALPRPILGFAGNLTPAKVDYEVLRALAAAYPDGTILLAGPADGDAAAEVARLERLPNVRYLGRQSYDELPRAVAAFDVALIPYAATTYTQSCFPLKLYEYLAGGKPVVATGLPELAGMEPDVVLAEGPAGAAAAVAAALEQRRPEDVARRQRLAAAHTWEARAGTLLDLVAGALGPQEPAREVAQVGGAPA